MPSVVGPMTRGAVFDHVLVLGALGTIAPVAKTVGTDRLALDTNVANYIVDGQGGANDDIDGISGFNEGQFLLLHAATGRTITLKDEDAGAAADTDKIRTIGGVDMPFGDDEAVLLYHDDTLDRWIVISGPAASLNAHIANSTNPHGSPLTQSQAIIALTNTSLIQERVADTGVTVDGVLLKDGGIANTSGDLKIEPDVEGDVILFGDTDVDDAASGKTLYVYRMAAEGDEYLRLYVTAGQVAMLHSTTNLVLQVATGKYIRLASKGHIFLNLGDNAGSDKLKIRDSGSVEVATIDSDGNAVFNGSVSVDTIAEKTTDAGVTIDGILLKDGDVDGAVMDADFNAKGDVLSASANDTPLILSVGSNDDVLTADSTEATGLKWAPPAGGATADQSKVFIVDVTGAGNISNKVFEDSTSPVDKVLVSFESDNDDITLHFEVHAEGVDWQPITATASGGGATPSVDNNEDWSQTTENGARVFTGTVQLDDADTSDSGLLITLSDGGTTTVDYTRTLNPPAILTIAFDNQGAQNPGDIYPDGTYVGQSAFKANDDIKVSGTCDSHATAVYIKDLGVTNGQGLQGPFTATAGVFNSGTDGGLATVKAGGSNDATAHLVIYAVWGGADGDDFNSETDQAPATCVLNNLSPSWSETVDYMVGAAQPFGPEGHRGMRNGGTCEVTAAITNHTASRIAYSVLNGAPITAPANTYAATKTWTHNGTAGDWWDSVDGYSARIFAHYDVNDNSRTVNFVIDLELNCDFNIPAGSGGGTLYQGSQICVGKSDDFRLTGSHEAAITKIRVTQRSHTIISGGQQNTVGGNTDSDHNVSGTTFDLEATTRTIALRDGPFTPRTVSLDIEVYKSGAWRTRHKVIDDSNGYGEIDTDTQTIPTFGSVVVAYDPAGQTALKGSEDATVDIEHTNVNGGETYAYDDRDKAELTIGNGQGTGEDLTTYQVQKWVRRIGGGYRVIVDNYKLVVTQPTYNGMTDFETATVQIADTAPLFVSLGVVSGNGSPGAEGTRTPAVCRSRTDPTDDKTYNVTAVYDQQMNTSTIQRDGTGTNNAGGGPDDGDALSATVGDPQDLTWQYDLVIKEANNKNLGSSAYYNWEASGGDWGKNIANQPCAAGPSAGDIKYRVAGFEYREIAFDTQFQREWAIGTRCSGHDNANTVNCQMFGWDELTYKTNITENSGGLEFTISDGGGSPYGFEASGEHFLLCDSSQYNTEPPLTMSIEEEPG